nr:hypothetical protein [Tanacetum cinerariifolium]
QTPGSGISILLAVGTPSTGSGKLYCQWELSPGSRNAFANSWQWDLHSSGSRNTLHWQWEVNPENDKDVSHLDDNMEIDGQNAKDGYSNSQHHWHLLIKALGSKLENPSIDSVVVVPPMMILCYVPLNQKMTLMKLMYVDSYDDDYMSLFNDEEQPAKSSLNDLELQQEPDIVDAKDGILKQQENANKGKTTVI